MSTRRTSEAGMMLTSRISKAPGGRRWPFDQGQGAQGAQAAQADGRIAQRRVVLERVENRRQLRVLVDEIVDAGGAAVLDFLALDLGDRRRRGHGLALDARTRDGDLVEGDGFFLGFGFIGLLVLGEREARNSHTCDKRECDRVPQFAGLQIHLSLSKSVLVIPWEPASGANERRQTQQGPSDGSPAPGKIKVSLTNGAGSAHSGRPPLCLQ
jgi:hypothetical protein